MVIETGDRIPTAYFDSDLLPPEARLQAWSALTPGYDKSLPLGADQSAFKARCRGWLLDDLVVTANYVTPVELSRTPAHIKAYPRDTYTLILLQDGHWRADFDAVSLQVGSGQICIMDFSVPWSVTGAEQTNVMMVLPRATLDAMLPDAPRLHGRILEGGAGRLFAEHMLSLARHLPELRRAEVPLVRDATLGLLGTAVRGLSEVAPLVPRHSQRALQIGRVRAYIDEHLTNPNLSPTTLCQQLAVTRPTLYRAFEADGGVASYIQRRRLEAAHARLADAERRESLADIADEFCFSSPAHFSTAFRRLFGFAPREARGGVRAAGARTLFETWRQALNDPKD